MMTLKVLIYYMQAFSYIKYNLVTTKKNSLVPVVAHVAFCVATIRFNYSISILPCRCYTRPVQNIFAPLAPFRFVNGEVSIVFQHNHAIKVWCHCNIRDTELLAQIEWTLITLHKLFHGSSQISLGLFLFFWLLSK